LLVVLYSRMASQIAAIFIKLGLAPTTENLN